MGREATYSGERISFRMVDELETSSKSSDEGR